MPAVMRYVQTDDQGVVEAVVEVGRPDDDDDDKLAEDVMRELKEQNPQAVAARLHKLDKRDRPEPGAHKVNPATGRTVQLTGTERQAYADRRAAAAGGRPA